MNRRDLQRVLHSLFSIAVLVTVITFPALAQQHPFGGVTVMDARNPEVGKALGLGGGQSKLLTLVAGDRSYVSFGADRSACNSWIRRVPGSPDTVILGDGDTWNFKGNPVAVTGEPRMMAKICPEVKLQRLDAKQAAIIKGNQRLVLPIIENYPILSIDWTDPSVSKFRVGGYGLGPVTKNDIPNMAKNLAQRSAALRYSQTGHLTGMTHGWEKNGRHFNVTATADVDRLVSDGRTDIVSLKYTVSSRAEPYLGQWQSIFQGLVQQYGSPSLVVDNTPGRGYPLAVIWAHDLYGRFIAGNSYSTEPCLQGITSKKYMLRPRAQFTDLYP